MIGIKDSFQPLYEIPEQSVVQLEDGKLVHFIGLKENTDDYPSGEGNWRAELRSFEYGHYDVQPGTGAKYVCSVIDWEGLAYRT